jgi:hypothetical protein
VLRRALPYTGTVVGGSGEGADGAPTLPEASGPVGDDGVLVKRMGRLIPCLGTGPDVPAYLRFQGSVRNRNMSKRDAERAVRDIWAKKILSDRGAAGGPRQSMEDFFYSYARHAFTVSSGAAAPVSTMPCSSLLYV